MVFLTTGDAAGRYLFSAPLVGSYEISEKYLMVYSVFFSFCFAYRHGANIRVTFFLTRLSGRWRNRVNYGVQIFSLIYILILLAASVIFILPRYDDNLILNQYVIPLAPAYLAPPVGLFFLALNVFLDLWEVKSESSGLFKEEAPDEVA
jgi:TRAP-type C4-dicarboxylate transport system permease small subunit